MFSQPEIGADCASGGDRGWDALVLYQSWWSTAPARDDPRTLAFGWYYLPNALFGQHSRTVCSVSAVLRFRAYPPNYHEGCVVGQESGMLGELLGLLIQKGDLSID